ncbi:alpha/beta hydrolase [Ancylobacter sp. G4_0304]|uniref:alpha/beta hydrolase n=1 Tax=Ancylobacter sp. G4_0304 TaxID=3114289 RepID=UPI0039C6A3FF
MMRGVARPLSRIAVLVVGAALLAGCADRPGADSLMATDASVPGVREHVILVASTRARDPRPGALYSGERSSELSFARIDMTVPPSHRAGHVEWPKTAPGNPATDMVVRSAVYRDTPKEFDAELKAELAKRPPGQRKVAIFVHGYNTQFNEALYRMAQLADDSRAPGVPVLFTWASRGETTDYVYDTNSATSARDNLEETIRLVFNSGAEKVTILAHSMGNWVTVEALRQIKISGNALPADKIDNIILAAPDIDVDVFKSQLKRFGKPAKPFIVVVSADDKALAFSRFIAGGENRLGAYTHDEELVQLGAVVIDMTKVKAQDDFNHGKFAQLAAMAPELQAIANSRKGSGARNNEVVVENIAFFGIDKIFPPPGAKANQAATQTAAAPKVIDVPEEGTEPPVTAASAVSGPATP